MRLWWRGVESGSMDADAPGPNDDEGAVRPEDLDIADDRRVVALDDRRYVVATANDGAPSPPEDAADESAETADESADDGGEAEDDGRPDRAAVREALIVYVEGRETRHGFAVVRSFDGEVRAARRRSPTTSPPCSVSSSSGTLPTSTPPPPAPKRSASSTRPRTSRSSTRPAHSNDSCRPTTGPPTTCCASPGRRGSAFRPSTTWSRRWPTTSCRNWPTAA